MTKQLLQLASILNQYEVVLGLARSRQTLRWAFHGTRYCQRIPEVNKVKRLVLVSKCLEENDRFDDVT